MQLKHSVKFGNQLIAVAFAVTVLNDIFHQAGYACVITSCNDGTHSLNSLHYSDAAFDLRSTHISTDEEKQRILKQVKEALTADFDALLEATGTESEHLHLQYDPK